MSRSPQGATSIVSDLLADELQVVDEDVVVRRRNVDLELNAVDLRLRDVRLARVSPAGHLLHRLPREDVLLPFVPQAPLGGAVAHPVGAGAAGPLRPGAWPFDPLLRA